MIVHTCPDPRGCVRRWQCVLCAVPVCGACLEMRCRICMQHKLTSGYCWQCNRITPTDTYCDQHLVRNTRLAARRLYERVQAIRDAEMILLSKIYAGDCEDGEESVNYWPGREQLGSAIDYLWREQKRLTDDARDINDWLLSHGRLTAPYPNELAEPGMSEIEEATR